MGSEANARDSVHQISKIDTLVRADAGEFANGFAFAPFGKRLGEPLIGDLKPRSHILLKPLYEFAKVFRSLGLVSCFGLARSCGGQIERGGVAAQDLTKLLVNVGQTQEEFVGLLLILEVWWVERLDEVKIEVPRRHRRRSLVRGAKEEVSLTGSFMIQPFQFVLPDPVARDVSWQVDALHDLFQSLVVVAVELREIERFCALVDQGVIVVGLLEVQIILAVVRVGRDELTAHRLVDFPEYRFDLGKQVVRWDATQLSDTGLEEA